MLERTVKIINKAGLHTRPAAAIVKTAARFHSDFVIQKDGYEINGKSIIGVMTLAAEYGSSLILRFSGEDEDQALMAMEALFADGFGEL
jgi:phosphocarrier protein